MAFTRPAEATWSAQIPTFTKFPQRRFRWKRFSIISGPASARSPRLFIDACHSGVELDNNVRDTIDHLSVEELEAFFKEADYRVAFASCRANEKSYTSLQAQNGIWSHFLIKALRGEADEAVKDGHVTSASLQDYLAKNVPRRAKAENGAGASQHPQLFGRHSNTFRVADLRPLIAAREADKRDQIPIDVAL